MAKLSVQWVNYANTMITGNMIMNDNMGANACFANATTMGDAIATSLNGFATLVDQDWELMFTLNGRMPNGRVYLGLCSADVAFTSDVEQFQNWTHCIYISTETWSTATPPHPAGTVYIYEGSSTPKYWLDGIWQSTGQEIAMRCLGDVICYHVGDRVIYRSITPPQYPMEAVVAMACYDQEVMVDLIIGPNVGVGSGDIEQGPTIGTGTAGTWNFPSPDLLPQPPLADAPIPVRFQETITDWKTYSQQFGDNRNVSNTQLTGPIRVFEVQWDGLSESQAAMLDNHYQSTSGGISFTVIHPHTDEVLTGCRYAAYSRSSHTRYWSQSRQATLIKYVL